MKSFGRKANDDQIYCTISVQFDAITFGSFDSHENIWISDFHLDPSSNSLRFLFCYWNYFLIYDQIEIF